jgi:hypothetical protein
MSKYKLKDFVIYKGKTYTFTGKISAITDDGQYVVTALQGGPYRHAEGKPPFEGMKHIYGESQLEPWDGL